MERPATGNWEIEISILYMDNLVCTLSEIKNIRICIMDLEKKILNNHNVSLNELVLLVLIASKELKSQKVLAYISGISVSRISRILKSCKRKQLIVEIKKKGDFQNLSYQISDLGKQLIRHISDINQFSELLETIKKTIHFE